jgi:D-serine deaminase-like pyridoxal phosphate-dependent protein
VAHKKTPAAVGAAGAGTESGGTEISTATLIETPICFAGDRLVLAQRISCLRRQRAIEAAAGRLIDRHPGCPRPASLLVDQLTYARDLAMWEGRA